MRKASLPNVIPLYLVRMSHLGDLEAFVLLYCNIQYMSFSLNLLLCILFYVEVQFTLIGEKDLQTHKTLHFVSLEDTQTMCLATDLSDRCPDAINISLTKDIYLLY